MPRPRHTRLAHHRAGRLRHNMTPAEALLWSGIQRRAAGARFRRQVPIGHWIAGLALSTRGW